MSLTFNTVAVKRLMEAAGYLPIVEGPVSHGVQVRAKGVSVNLYTTGTIVVQGSDHVAVAKVKVALGLKDKK